MRTVKVDTYKQLLSGMYSNRCHSILKFSRKQCTPCKEFESRLVQKKDLNVVVYDVNVHENKMIAKIFNVRSLPTAVFFEDSMPVARMTGLGEADDFLNIVEDVVTRGCHVIDYDRDPSAAQRNFVLSDDDTA